MTKDNYTRLRDRYEPKYGRCDACNSILEPVFFTEHEYDKDGHRTGRVRRAVSHLECPVCFERFVVDDTFDSPYWRESYE